jgi:hypothetical protein
MIEGTFPESIIIFMSNMTQAKASLTKMFRRKQQQLFYKLKASRKITINL